MTEFDIQRTAQAVVDLLLCDDRFIRRMERMAPKRSRMLKTRQAAERLGISRDKLLQAAPYIGGVKSGEGNGTRWTFDEASLKERYIEYLNGK